MKGNVLKVCTVILSVWCLLCSCRKDRDDIYVSYGVIGNVESKSRYEIFTDMGNRLVVTQSYTSAAIEEGKRILANYEILSDRDKSKKVYEVKVNGFYQLLSKPFVKESFILEDEPARRDSIGNDPFYCIDAWFGGDYLNIDFMLYYLRGSGKKHLINLVYDDVRSTADTVYLAFRHNAGGEIPGSGLSLSADWGRCSFRIVDLLPEGASSMPVKLTWRQYGYSDEATDCFDAQVFKKGDNKVFEKKFPRTDFDNTLEVK